MPEEDLERIVRNYAKRASILPKGDRREMMIEAYAHSVIKDFYKYDNDRLKTERMLQQFNHWLSEYRSQYEKRGHYKR